MIFEKNTDVEEELYELISPEDFSEYICELNEKVVTDYPSAVYKECRNAVAWIIRELKDTFYIHDIKVNEGTFQGKDHCWISVGDYNIDLTLAQFIECPKFAVSLVENNSKIGYFVEQNLSVYDWVRQQKDAW